MEVVPETLGLVPYVRVPLLTIAALLGAASLIHRPGGSADVYTNDTVEARVRSTEHLREHERAPIDIEIRNTSGVARDMIVMLSPDYVNSFDDVAMIPEPTDGWSVRLEDVAPGEERLVALELEASVPGARHGEVRIQPTGGSELAIPLRTYVAP